MFDAIIFDLEGVVLDTEPLWDKSQLEFLRRRGRVYDRAKTKHLLGGKTLAEGAEIMMAQYGFSGNADELAKERSEIMDLLLRTELKFIPGFESFYASVKGKYKTAVGTSMRRELLSIASERTRILELFANHVYSIEDVNNISKPNPDVFLYAARKINASPQRCIVIEDMPNGIEAAKRAKMRCIALTTSIDASKLSEADAVVDSYEQLAEVIKTF